ncbi:MAG: class I SAM-dependent methyltransferase [Pseudomonadota bacterium]
MSEPVTPLDDSTAAVNIAELMREIRERIKADMEAHRDERAALSPLAGKFVDARGIKYGDLQHAENLRYLNVNYNFESKLTPDSVVTHRGGLLGRLVVLFKRKSIGFLRNSLLARYLEGESGFVQHLVRHLNDTGRYIDARDERISRDLEVMLQRVDDEKTQAIFALQRQMVDLVGGFEQRLAQVDAMVRGLEGIMTNGKLLMNPAPPVARQAEASDKGVAAPDPSYLLLENRFRGSESEIARRLGVYVDLFKGATGPVLDIGCGRGELQRLFKEASIDSYGVDLDAVMVNQSIANGCKVMYGDGIAHLRSLEDGSLGGVVAIQVVEHLTRQQLHELFALAKVKVRKGGKIAFETINPQSLLALSSNYFRDPTHVWPMHPDTLGYMATLAGLKIVETKMLSPVAVNHLLKEIPVDSSHTPAVGDAIRRINDNFGQLNRLIYGFQDYCLVLEA